MLYCDCSCDYYGITEGHGYEVIKDSEWDDYCTIRSDTSEEVNVWLGDDMHLARDYEFNKEDDDDEVMCCEPNS